MASRYWVGGTGTWDATTTTNWSATSGGSGGASVPGTTDDVFFDSNSGTGTVTRTVASTSQSIDMLGSSVSVAWNNDGFINTPSTGTFRCRLRNVTFGNLSLLSLRANGTATILYDEGGAAGNHQIGINSAVNSGTVTFETATSNVTTLTHTSGTLHVDGATDNAGLSHTWGSFAANNNNTKTVYWGAANINLTVGGSSQNPFVLWPTGTTIAANTATVTIKASAANGSFNCAGAINFNGLSLVCEGNNSSRQNGLVFAGSTIQNLTLLNQAITTDHHGFGSDVIVNGNLTITGNSATNRVLIHSDTLGTQRTITVNGTVTLTNADFRDINTGGTAWASATISGGVGDCGGNSATIIGYTPSVTQYWKTTTGTVYTWSTAANWFLATNGGGGAGRVPLPQDDVVFDASSIGAASTIISIDMPRLGRSIDLSAATNNPTWNRTMTSTLYGSLAYPAVMAFNGAQQTVFEGRGSYTLNTGSATSDMYNTLIQMVGGTLTLQSNKFFSQSTVQVSAGTFNANGLDVQCFAFTSTGSLTRTVTMGSGTWTITGTGGFTLSSTGLTWTTPTGTLTYTNTSGTSTLTTAGQTFNNITMNGTGGSLSLSDSLTCTGTITHSAGTLNTNNKTVSCAQFATNTTNTRTLTLGSSTITLTGGGTAWLNQNATGLTVTANTATVQLTGANGLFYSNAVNWNGLSVIISGSGNGLGFSGTGSFTVANLTRIGTAVTTDTAQFVNGNTVTVTGTLTLQGNSSVNRLLVTSATLGSSAAIVCNGSVVASNVDFKDIAASGTASWNLSTITGLSGDCGGNSGITFTTSQANYWKADTGNWSDSTKWFLSDHTTPGRVPLPQDDAVFDSLSFTAATKTVTADTPRMCKNLTASTVNKTGITISRSQNTVYGSVTLSSGISLSQNTTMFFEGRSSCTLVSAGTTIVGTMQVQMPGGTLTLGDALNVSVGFTLNNGTFDAAGYSVVAQSVTIANTSATRSLVMGAGTWRLTGTGTVWFSATLTGFTFNSTGSTIAIDDTSSSTKTFTGNGLTFNNVTITGGGTGTVTITGGNTFGTLTINSPKTVILPASSVQTISSLVVVGTSGVAIKSSLTSTPSYLSASSGTISVDYVNITDVTATGGATWYAGSNSTLTRSPNWILGSPSTVWQLSGSTAGTSLLLPVSFSYLSGLFGITLGSSSDLAVATVKRSLGGSTSSVGSTTGFAVGAKKFSGHSDGQASGSASASVLRRLLGVATSLGQTIGSFGQPRSVSGVVAGTSQTIGYLNRARGLDASTTSSSSAQAVLAVRAYLFGIATGAGSTEGRANALRSVAGESTGSSALLGIWQLTGALSGTVVAASSCISTLVKRAVAHTVTFARGVFLPRTSAKGEFN